jgi:hypothetical protein
MGIDWVKPTRINAGGFIWNTASGRAVKVGLAGARPKPVVVTISR